MTTDLSTPERAQPRSVEEAQELLVEGRGLIGALDEAIIVAIATYLEQRGDAVDRFITPAKLFLKLPAYAHAQHEERRNLSLIQADANNVPRAISVPLIDTAMTSAVERQLPLLGGSGIPNPAELHIAQ